MKYLEKDFTIELKEKIDHKENSLKELLIILLQENKPVYENIGLVLDGTFDREKPGPFQPGYCSSISIGISDKSSGELIDIHNITIWECTRYFLGIPISTKIPGSKIVGELLDESLEDIKLEIEEYVQEQMTLNRE